MEFEQMLEQIGLRGTDDLCVDLLQEKEYWKQHVNIAYILHRSGESMVAFMELFAALEGLLSVLTNDAESSIVTLYHKYYRAQYEWPVYMEAYRTIHNEIIIGNIEVGSVIRTQDVYNMLRILHQVHRRRALKWFNTLEQTQAIEKGTELSKIKQQKMSV